MEVDDIRSKEARPLRTACAGEELGESKWRPP